MQGGVPHGHSGHSQLDVQEDPLVLPHVDPPHAVLPLHVGLRPVWGQDHPGRSRQLPATHGCGGQTDRLCGKANRTERLGVWGDQVRQPRAPCVPLGVSALV